LCKWWGEVTRISLLVTASGLFIEALKKESVCVDPREELLVELVVESLVHPRGSGGATSVLDSELMLLLLLVVLVVLLSSSQAAAAAAAAALLLFI
tara:strand:- start:15 stop:302 length:288 start_codon:yes stop_codon:yes gene_type:complete